MPDPVTDEEWAAFLAEKFADIPQDPLPIEDEK